MSSAISCSGEGANTLRLLASQEARAGRPGSEELTEEDEAEVLSFLAQRPLDTVFMAGLIRDNGLVSACNPGIFYGYRNTQGALEGVALVGIKTVIEAREPEALGALARYTRGLTGPRLMRGRRAQMEWLLDYARRSGQKPRRVCSELLLEQRAPVQGVEPIAELRPASLAEVEQVIEINAEMVLEESGIDPRQVAPQGMTERAVRRIESGRVWVYTAGGKIIFKADLISETPEAIFLEGIYVRPEERGKGYGFRCLTQLAEHLLARATSLCLVVNQANDRAQALYQKAGYKLAGQYLTAYF